MKIADLDTETRAVVVQAHIVAECPTKENLEKLRSKLNAFDDKHAEEQNRNLFRILFGTYIHEYKNQGH